MTKSPTRQQIDEWKRCLLDLPDELFFSIMKLYLGDLKTPFHKPRLVDQIIHLFSKEDTIQRAVALIDPQDALILTAVELLDRPSPQQIYHLLQDSYDYFNFHNHLMNLQERLIIFSCSDNPLLHINPFLHQDILKSVLSPAELFPPATPYKVDSGLPILATEEILWCIIAQLKKYPEPLKADGTLKKKVSDELKSIFSTLAEDKKPNQFYLLINALLKLGILEKDRNSLQLVFDRGIKFGNKTRAERLFYLWAAVCISSDESVEDFSASSLSINQLAHIAASIESLFATMPPDYLFEPTSVERMLIAAEPVAGEKPITELIAPTRLIERLQHIRALVGSSQGIYRNPSIADLLNDQEEKKPLLVHPDFTITVKPPLPFEVGLFISSVMQLKSFTAYPQFELTRNSYLHGRSHFSSDTIQQRVDELSATPLPQNIRFSLESWESHYSSVVMIEGITLSLADHWDHMVRNHPDFAAYILRDFGNGIYVMDASHRKNWQALLQEIGIIPLPPVESCVSSQPDTNTSAAAQQFPSLPSPSPQEQSMVDSFSGAESPKGPSEADKKVYQELQHELEHLPNANSNQKKELAAQIEKKLFLFPSQLHHTQTSPSVNEARGINYSGKVRIIQQALQSEWDLLELVERTASGKPLRHLVRPRELQKSGNDLLLRGESLPTNEEFEVWVQKIGYIKKWKGSLFIQPQDYKQS
ncbi:MAG: hypothetical protein R6V86_00495 [Spirochaetia bacterium]